jgi:hypothetical protein
MRQGLARRLTANIAVRPTADGAEATSYRMLDINEPEAEQVGIGMADTYQDRFEKTDESGRFVSRNRRPGRADALSSSHRHVGVDSLRETWRINRTYRTPAGRNDMPDRRTEKTSQAALAMKIAAGLAGGIALRFAAAHNVAGYTIFSAITAPDIAGNRTTLPRFLTDADVLVNSVQGTGVQRAAFRGGSAS